MLNNLKPHPNGAKQVTGKSLKGKKIQGGNLKNYSKKFTTFLAEEGDFLGKIVDIIEADGGDGFLVQIEGKRDDGSSFKIFHRQTSSNSFSPAFADFEQIFEDCEEFDEIIGSELEFSVERSGNYFNITSMDYVEEDDE